jgi:hypothetical protein
VLHARNVSNDPEDIDIRVDFYLVSELTTDTACAILEHDITDTFPDIHSGNKVSPSSNHSNNVSRLSLCLLMFSLT